MPRPQKVWFREQTGWWMVTVRGKKTPLAKGFENRPEAERKFHELMLTKSEAPESPTARVADVVEAFLVWASTHVGEETNKQYRHYGQKLAEDCGLVPVRDFKPIHVTRWVAKRGWSGSSEYNARRYAFRFFSWAHDEGILAKNPLKGMKRPKPLPRQRAMLEGEYEALYAATDADFRPLLFALKHTGARPAEMRRLRWGQIRGDHILLTDHKTVKKTRKPRVIVLTPEMQEFLRGIREERGVCGPEDHVFLNSEGKPWTTNAVRLRVMRLKKRLGLADDVCAYLIRHAFCTNALLNQ